MTAYPIDTLATARELEQAGFQTAQAEAVAKAIAHTGQELATKADLAALERSLRHDMSGMRWMFGVHIALTLALFGVVLHGFGFLS